MKSWIVSKPGELVSATAEDVSLPQEAARIRMTRAAVSPSDIAAFQGKAGKLPLIPCRIAMGLVGESNDITLKIGQRVMLSPYRHTEKGTLIKGVDCDGYLSDFVTCPQSEIYVIPEGISDEAVVFAEDIALAVNVLEKLDISKTQYILLHGCTTLNFIIAQLAIYYQAIPIIADTRRDMLELAEDMGVYFTANPDEEDLLDKVKELTSGKMCDCVVVDADFFPETGKMLSCLKTGGKAGIFGMGNMSTEASAPVAEIVSKRLEVFGVQNGDGELETAINMLATEIVKVDKLVAGLEEFKDAPQVFERLAKSPSPGLKTLIRF